LNPAALKNGLFKSQRFDWQTPDYIFQILNDEFDFDFDPCPPDPQFDGLKISWGERNFVNPPYGRQIQYWLKKGYQEAQQGKLVVFLIPSRTDTVWWHDYVMKADEIRFIRGRLKFKGAKNNAPFPSAIVIYQGNYKCLITPSPSPPRLRV